MKLSSAGIGGVTVFLGLAVLYLAVTGQLDKLDTSLRSGWNAARGSWGGTMLRNLGPQPHGDLPRRPTSNGAPPAFQWPLPSLS